MIYESSIASVVLEKADGEPFVHVYGTGILSTRQIRAIASIDRRVADPSVAWNCIKYHFPGFMPKN